MVSSVVRAFVLVLLVAAPARAQVALPAPPTQQWFALDLDFGIAHEREVSGLHYQQRVRAGLSWVKDWRFWNLLATAETLDFDRYAFGVQGDVIAFNTALGGYLGPSISNHGDVNVTVGVGWNVFFLEAQALDLNHSATYQLSAVLRIPLGELSYALWGPRPTITIPLPK